MASEEEVDQYLDDLVERAKIDIKGSGTYIDLAEAIFDFAKKFKSYDDFKAAADKLTHDLTQDNMKLVASRVNASNKSKSSQGRSFSNQMRSGDLIRTGNTRRKEALMSGTEELSFDDEFNSILQSRYPNILRVIKKVAPIVYDQVKGLFLSSTRKNSMVALDNIHAAGVFHPLNLPKLHHYLEAPRVASQKKASSFSFNPKELPGHSAPLKKRKGRF
jgi:hypothetical protein